MDHLHVTPPSDNAKLGTRLALAEALARVVHAGQLRKDGEPYVKHLERVAGAQTNDRARIIAWLHDTIEDTAVRYATLRELGFSSDILDAVEALTREDAEWYQAFVQRTAMSNDPDVIEVKLADLRDNLSRPYPGSESLISRYRKAEKVLSDARTKFTEEVDLLEEVWNFRDAEVTSADVAHNEAVRRALDIVEEVR